MTSRETHTQLFGEAGEKTLNRDSKFYRSPIQSERADPRALTPGLVSEAG